MRSSALLLIVTAAILFGCTAGAQITERERPAGWDRLVYGGRFMDRFLPMPVQGELTTDTWGADNVVPRYVDNGIEDSQWSYWGGNSVLGPDGKYHLFVCRWREDSSRGHAEWPRSIVVHAIADRPTGPYKVKDTVGPGHNPEAFLLKDGRYVVYVMGAYYISDSLDGPWQKSKFEFDPRGRRIIQGLSNLSFAQREDGSYLMVCRGGGIWFSKTGISPYQQVTDRRVYPPVPGNFEDPVVWRTSVQYHMIVNDWRGRIAYHLRSKDGIHWKVDPGEAYMPGIARYEDGTVEDWFKYERIKVLQDKHGRATMAHFAVIDVLKKEDKGSDNHSSKHICIPLTVPRLLTILNQEPITPKTKTICVKIEAEDDFNPHTDMDIRSLRFGAPEQVDFGNGCTAIMTETSGRDLIVTFNPAGNGFTEDNFVGKLLGRTSDGKLLFGYARLPWLNYLQPALSTLKPEWRENADGPSIAVEIQNFGQVPSEPMRIDIVNTDNAETVATGSTPPLKPFEKTTLQLRCDDAAKDSIGQPLSAIIDPASE